MSADEEPFKVDNELRERLINKYRTFATKVVESDTGPNKIHIQLSIAAEHLKIPDEELKNKFNELCTALLETCRRHHIPCKPVYILVLTDAEIDRGLQLKLKNEKDGSMWDIVFIPPLDLNGPYAFWNYTFLHELAHCWISLKFKDLKTEEIFMDLVAISALARTVQPGTKMFKETITLRSYVGGKQGKEYLGKYRQKRLSKDPEACLKYMLDIMKSKSGLVRTRRYTPGGHMLNSFILYELFIYFI